MVWCNKMEHQKEGISTLAEIEKSAETHVESLLLKIHDLRQKLIEEKIVTGQLQEIACGLQGRISVHLQRVEELGVENFGEIMAKAEDELENAKQELIIVTNEISTASKDMAIEVALKSAQFDGLRAQFKDIATMDSCFETDSARCAEIDMEIKAMEERISEIDDEEQDIKDTLQGFAGVDKFMQQGHEDIEEIKGEINGINFKLHLRRHDYSLK